MLLATKFFFSKLALLYALCNNFIDELHIEWVGMQHPAKLLQVLNWRAFALAAHTPQLRTCNYSNYYMQISLALLGKNAWLHNFCYVK